MLKHTLTTSALAILLASGAFAQTEPAADPAQDAPPPAADPATPPATLTPEAGMEGDTMPATPGERTPVDVSTVSAEQLIGADIHSLEGETIASVSDVLVTDDGQIENVVAKFGGVLGFGSNEVLLSPDELQFMQDAGGAIIVETSLTPESLEGRPEYEPDDTAAPDTEG